MIYAGLAIEQLIDKSKYTELGFLGYDRETGKVIVFDEVRSNDSTIPLRLLAVKPFSVEFSGNCAIFHYWR